MSQTLKCYLQAFPKQLINRNSLDSNCLSPPSNTRDDISQTTSALEDVGSIPFLKLIKTLWNLLKLLFVNMYKGLDDKELSMEESYLNKLNGLLTSKSKEIRKLCLLIVVVRLKFQKKFRRRWMHLFPDHFYGKRILLGKIWHVRGFNPSLIDSESLKYTQATLIYSMNTLCDVDDFDEYSLGKLIGLKDLNKVPDPSSRYIWFDRLVNKKIKLSLLGKTGNQLTRVRIIQTQLPKIIDIDYSTSKEDSNNITKGNQSYVTYNNIINKEQKNQDSKLIRTSNNTITTTTNSNKDCAYLKRKVSLDIEKISVFKSIIPKIVHNRPSKTTKDSLTSSKTFNSGQSFKIRGKKSKAMVNQSFVINKRARRNKNSSKIAEGQNITEMEKARQTWSPKKVRIQSWQGKFRTRSKTYTENEKLLFKATQKKEIKEKKEKKKKNRDERVRFFMNFLKKI